MDQSRSLRAPGTISKGGPQGNHNKPQTTQTQTTHNAKKHRASAHQIRPFAFSSKGAHRRDDADPSTGRPTTKNSTTDMIQSPIATQDSTPDKTSGCGPTQIPYKNTLAHSACQCSPRGNSKAMCQQEISSPGTMSMGRGSPR